MNEHYVINLGRQLGSGGKEIGEKLAKELGIAFYDKELINLASKESGLCREFFEKADEKASQSILGGLFGFPSSQASSSNTRINSSPMIFRFCSGSVTPASFFRKRS